MACQFVPNKEPKTIESRRCYVFLLAVFCMQINVGVNFDKNLKRDLGVGCILLQEH
jgi:hypothetical protein